jgi:hypothetical protein
MDRLYIFRQTNQIIKMKKQLLIIPAILLLTNMAFAQQKPKCDTLTEKQVIEISQLLNFGEVAAGNSDKVSTNQYNQYHIQVAKIDSVLGIMYRHWHPVKVAEKGGKKQ